MVKTLKPFKIGVCMYGLECVKFKIEVTRGRNVMHKKITPSKQIEHNNFIKT